MSDNNKLIQFEPFKNAKKWDDEYPKFLGNTEKFFGAKTNPEEMAKRLYYALRYLDGVSKSFWIFSLLGIPTNAEELKRGKKYMIEWLEQILKNMKEGV